MHYNFHTSFTDEPNDRNMDIFPFDVINSYGIPRKKKNFSFFSHTAQIAKNRDITTYLWFYNDACVMIKKQVKIHHSSEKDFCSISHK